LKGFCRSHCKIRKIQSRPTQLVSVGPTYSFKSLPQSAVDLGSDGLFFFLFSFFFFLAVSDQRTTQPSLPRLTGAVLLDQHIVRCAKRLYSLYRRHGMDKEVTSQSTRSGRHTQGLTTKRRPFMAFVLLLGHHDDCPICAINRFDCCRASLSLRDPSLYHGFVEAPPSWAQSSSLSLPWTKASVLANVSTSRGKREDRKAKTADIVGYTSVLFVSLMTGPRLQGRLSPTGS
ncbi:hypothetical protein KCU94_g267, partial [Aureobasidium melanogenum]